MAVSIWVKYNAQPRVAISAAKSLVSPSEEKAHTRSKGVKLELPYDRCHLSTLTLGELPAFKVGRRQRVWPRCERLLVKPHDIAREQLQNDEEDRDSREGLRHCCQGLRLEGRLSGRKLSWTWFSNPPSALFGDLVRGETADALQRDSRNPKNPKKLVGCVAQVSGLGFKTTEDLNAAAVGILSPASTLIA
eukprot:scaffold27254_cov70-Phaeocystis_antarctica.AAC.6